LVSAPKAFSFAVVRLPCSGQSWFPTSLLAFTKCSMKFLQGSIDLLFESEVLQVEVDIVLKSLDKGLEFF
jgi:hypothetical protein